MNADPWEDYGRSVHMFVAGLGTGIPVDFSTRKLVGVAHSMGCIALCVLYHVVLCD